MNPHSGPEGPMIIMILMPINTLIRSRNLFSQRNSRQRRYLWMNTSMVDLRHFSTYASWRSLLDFKVTGDSIKDYYRELNMETGIVKICYTDGDVKMTHEVFMSYPDHVMVMKVSADKPGCVSVEAKLKSPLEQTNTNTNKLTINGIWNIFPRPKTGLLLK